MSRLNCRECGEPLVRSPSGYVCEKGHGRIVQRQMPQAKSKAEVCQVMSQLHGTLDVLVASDAHVDHIHQAVADVADQYDRPTLIETVVHLACTTHTTDQG